MDNAEEKSKVTFANGAGVAFQLKAYSIDDACNHVTRCTVKSALLHRRVQLLRNAGALVACQARLGKGTADDKANALAEVINCVPQHFDCDGGVAVQSVQGVVCSV